MLLLLGSGKGFQHVHQPIGDAFGGTGGRSGGIGFVAAILPALQGWVVGIAAAVPADGELIRKRTIVPDIFHGTIVKLAGSQRPPQLAHDHSADGHGVGVRCSATGQNIAGMVNEYNCMLI